MRPSELKQQIRTAFAVDDERATLERRFTVALAAGLIAFGVAELALYLMLGPSQGWGFFGSVAAAGAAAVAAATTRVGLGVATGLLTAIRLMLAMLAAVAAAILAAIG